MQSEGATAAPLKGGHFRLPEQPTQNVETAVPAAKHGISNFVTDNIIFLTNNF
jgi:hypothetical protein